MEVGWGGDEGRGATRLYEDEEERGGEGPQWQISLENRA